MIEQEMATFNISYFLHVLFRFYILHKKFGVCVCVYERKRESFTNTGS